MKNLLKISALASALTLIVFACEDPNTEEIVASDDPISLIGTVDQRIASEYELQNLPKPGTFDNTRVGCSLGSDTGCDEADDDVEYFIQNCTVYARSWPPSGVVSQFYKGLSYYVDADSDINLDQYEDDLQTHINEIIAVKGSAAFISGQVLTWPCSDRTNNIGVILYEVYE